MLDYLIKDNDHKWKTQYDLSINKFSLETLSTVRICDYSLKNIRDLIWSDLISKSIGQLLWISDPHFKKGSICFWRKLYSSIALKARRHDGLRDSSPVQSPDKMLVEMDLNWDENTNFKLLSQIFHTYITWCGLWHEIVIICLVFSTCEDILLHQLFLPKPEVSFYSRLYKK